MPLCARSGRNTSTRSSRSRSWNTAARVTDRPKPSGVTRSAATLRMAVRFGQRARLVQPERVHALDRVAEAGGVAGRQRGAAIDHEVRIPAAAARSASSRLRLARMNAWPELRAAAAAAGTRKARNPAACARFKRGEQSRIVGARQSEQGASFVARGSAQHLVDRAPCVAWPTMSSSAMLAAA